MSNRFRVVTSYIKSESVIKTNIKRSYVNVMFHNKGIMHKIDLATKNIKYFTLKPSHVKYLIIEKW